jgi:hypothetical protein
MIDAVGRMIDSLGVEEEMLASTSSAERSEHQLKLQIMLSWALNFLDGRPTSRAT